MLEIKSLNEFVEEAQSYDEIFIYGAGGLGQWIMKNKVYIFRDTDICSKMNCFCDQQADVLQNYIKEKSAYNICRFLRCT